MNIKPQQYSRRGMQIYFPLCIILITTYTLSMIAMKLQHINTHKNTWSQIYRHTHILLIIVTNYPSSYFSKPRQLPHKPSKGNKCTSRYTVILNKPQIKTITSQKPISATHSKLAKDRRSSLYFSQSLFNNTQSF